MLTIVLRSFEESQHFGPIDLLTHIDHQRLIFSNVELARPIGSTLNFSTMILVSNTRLKLSLRLKPDFRRENRPNVNTNS